MRGHYGSQRRGHGMGILGSIFEKVIELIVIIVILYLIYRVLINGDYWFGLLGDMVNGLINGIGTFIDKVG